MNKKFYITYADLPLSDAPRAWVEVNAEAIRYNYRRVSEEIAKKRPECSIIAVIKGDAYGHGITECTRIFLSEGCRSFALANVEEALCTKRVCDRYGVRADILIFGATEPALIGEVRADGTRCGEIVYSLPEAFRGLRISTDSGVWAAELGEVRISGRAAEALGAPLAIFTQDLAAASAELSGNAQTLITVNTGNGSIEFTVDGKSGMPTSICEKNQSGEAITEFKITEYKTQNPSE